MKNSINCEKLYRLSQSELLLIKGGTCDPGGNTPNDDKDGFFGGRIPGK